MKKFSFLKSIRCKKAELCTPELFSHVLADPFTQQTWQQCQDIVGRMDKLRADVVNNQTAAARSQAEGAADQSQAEGAAAMSQAEGAADQSQAEGALTALAEDYRRTKGLLPAFCFHASFAGGVRKNDAAEASGLMMIDLDHIQGDARDYYRRKVEGVEPAAGIVYAHLTPSGHGIHLICNTPIAKGLSFAKTSKVIAEAQAALVRSLGIEEYFDECTKDLARCSFACPAEATLYLDLDALFADPEIPEAPKAPKALKKSAAARALLSFRGVPYSTIISEYWRQNGGEPVEGERNVKLFRLALALRYVCDNREELLMAVMPRYGLSEEEMKGIIRNACQARLYGQNLAIEPVLNAVGLGVTAAEKAAAAPDGTSLQALPPMPDRLPSLMDLLTSRVDKAFRPAVAMGMFAPLDTHMSGVSFRHITGEMLEPGCLSLLIAPFSSGKSSVNGPINAVMRDITENDLLARKAEQDWRAECEQLGANKNRPPRPTAPIQWIQPNATAASFLDLLLRAQGKSLYVRCDEIELLDRFADGNRGCATELLRVAYDHSEWGAERVSSSSISGTAALRMNMNCSTTIVTARRYLKKGIADGTLSRLTISTIKRDPYAPAPMYGDYDEDFLVQLQPYIDRLREANGCIECEECQAFIRKIDEETRRQAALTEDLSLLHLYKRALVSATRRAMTLFIAEGQWNADIEDFVRWSYLYDLEAKRMFFGDLLAETLRLEESTQCHRGPANMLEQLPTVFTRQQLIELRLRNGHTGDPRQILGTWHSRGYIENTEAPNTYRKLLV